MLILKKITKIFGQKPILTELTATVNKGDFITMVGANGSGKSTLLNLIAGTVQPESGTMLMQGNDITNTNAHFRTKWISQLFQNPKINTIAHMTVAENLALALMKGRTVSLGPGQQACTERDIQQIEKEYGINLQPFLNQKMSSLSGGQRQLLAFIMATIQKPQLLLLDEPTAALDPQAATTLLASADRFIKEHHMTTILVTHDPQLALTLGNRLWVLKNNQLHQFNEKQKSSLSPQDLIGQIDYAQIEA